MTITSTTVVTSYAGDDSTVSFSIPFLFFDNDHVKATLTDSSGADTVWTRGTQYTVSGAGNPAGGTLTVQTLPTDYTPATGETLTIERVTPLTQATSLPLGGPLPSASVEQMVDKVVMNAQELVQSIARKLGFPSSDSVTLSAELPTAANRASKYLAFDANGEPIASTGPTGDSSIPVSSFIETLLDDADAGTARTTIGAAGLADANAFTATQSWAKGADVASANALGLGTDGNHFDITGTTAITSIDTIGVGTVVKLHFDGALTLTHHATDLILPGAQDITTAAGDEAEFVEYATGDWRCTHYTPASGFGRVVQVVDDGETDVATGTTTTPDDDTIPQNTEGNEFATATITPKNASNTLIIEGVFVGSSSVASRVVAALYQDSTANGLAATVLHWDSADVIRTIYVRHKMTAGTVAATTFKLRVGGNNAGTITRNGYGGARKYGGILRTSITITEVGG